MLPGRFPPPSPSRETTPVDISSSPSEDFARQFTQTSAQSRPVSSDFIAPDHLRKRPRFTDAQSAPEIRLSASSGSVSSDRSLRSASSSPINHSARSRRTVSAPLHSQSLSTIHGAPNAIRKPTRQKRQRLSDNSPDNNPPVQPQSYGAAFPSPSTPPQNTSPSPFPHQAPKEPPTPELVHSPPEPQTCPLSSPTLTEIRSIHEKLLFKLLEPITPDAKPGFLYILQNPKRPSLGYKIGTTTSANPEVRFKKLEQDCNFIPEEEYFSGIKMPYGLRTEQLVQLDLKDYVQHWACDEHEGIHKEWFVVDKDIAVAAVKRWEKFMCDEQPYGTLSGRVKPVWRHVLEKRRGAFVFGAEELRSHNARRECWAAMLAPPSTADYIQTYWGLLSGMLGSLYRKASWTWQFLTAFFVHLTTLVYGMGMLWVTRSSVAFVAFAFVLVCVGVSSRDRLQLGPTKKRARRVSRV